MQIERQIKKEYLFADIYSKIFKMSSINRYVDINQNNIFFKQLP